MAPDDLDRDKMYTAGGDDLDPDAEFELEPPDAEVLASEQRRAAEAINAHRKAIDINEVYRDLDANRDSEIVEEWLARFRNFRFQFQIKHLLILTAVVAILLMLCEWIGLGTLFIVGIMLAVAGVSLYLKLEENKRQEAADRRRRKMYAQRRAAQAAHTGHPIEAEELDEEPSSLSSNGEALPPATPARSFRFQFSLAQLLIVITVAALLLGLSGAIGGLSSLATICGLIALAGLAIPLFGLQVPDRVVFGWWMLLVLYIALSLITAIWPGLRGG